MSINSTFPGPSSLATELDEGLMSATDKKKLDGIESSANNYVHPASHDASMISTTPTRRFVTDEEKTAWTAATQIATQENNGLMNKNDKTKLDGIESNANNYIHPTTHPASMITTDITHRFVTDVQVSDWDSKASGAEVTTAEKGLMSATDKKKLDGISDNANNYVHPESHPATMIVEDPTHRFVTEDQMNAWGSKPSASLATPIANGLMSKEDKKKLDGVEAGANNYVHPSSHDATIITQDEMHRFATDEEKATWNGKAPTTVATSSINGLMSSADKAKLDAVAPNANNYVHPATHPATIITTDSIHRFVTDAEKNKWDSKADKTNASSTNAGLMSATDKTKLDGIETGANNYVHPESHPATMITEDATHKFTSDAEKTKWNAKPDDKFDIGLGNVTNDAQVKRSEMGKANGVATLGSDGKVPASQLPSYVDDVLEFDTFSKLPEAGESGKLYVTKDTNKTYRWSGTQYIEISESLALGQTSNTAYPGDKGKANADEIAKIKNGTTKVAKATNADTVNGFTVQSNVPINAKFTDTIYTHPESHPATMIVEDGSHRFATDTEKATWNAKASTSVATTENNGLMDSADKLKLDGIADGANNYVHPSSHPATMITQDANHRFATDTEKATWNAKASTSVATTSLNGLMSKEDKIKLDAIEDKANHYVHPESHPATMITPDASHRFVTDNEKSVWNSKASTSVATTGVNGLMSSSDKAKLDGIDSGANNYTHPSTHPATMITQDANHRFATDTEKATWNAKANANHTHDHITIEDARSENLSPNQLTHKKALYGEFKSVNKLDGIKCDGTYVGVLNVVPWTDNSGGNAYQLGCGYSGAEPRYSIRTGDLNSAEWGKWREIYHEGHKPSLVELGAAASSHTHTGLDIVEDSTHRFVTEAQINQWNSKPSAGTATQSSNGLMSKEDKLKLDGIAKGANNYVHPGTHPATMITQDTTHRFVNDTQISQWNNKANTSLATSNSNGLMSSADKTKLDAIAPNANNYVHPDVHPATMITPDASHRFVTDNEKSTWNNKADGGHTHTKAQVGLGNVDNTSDASKCVKYADGAGQANRLSLARKFSISGGAIAAEKDFNGDTNLNLEVNSIKEGYLTWGGKNHVGSYGPIDAAMVPHLGSNRLAFIPDTAITVERSTDSGKSWTNYTVPNESKLKLFSTNTAEIFLDQSGNATSSYMVRITIDTFTAKLYTELNKFIMYISTNGARGSYCTIEAATHKTPSTFETIVSKQQIEGWSGYNVINIPGLTTYTGQADSQYQKIRFVFGVSSIHASYKQGLMIRGIMGFGGMGWNTPSDMAANGHLYKYDHLKNAFFPGNVYCNINKRLLTEDDAIKGIKDSNDGRIIKMAYSKSALSNPSYFLTMENNEIRSTNKSQMCTAIGAAPATHSHSYLPLSGGTLSGATTFNNYLKLNAWSGYGSGTADMWYDGTAKKVFVDNATGLAVGKKNVILEGDSRLTNARPASDVSAWAKASTKPAYNKTEVGLANVTNDAQVKRSEMGVANGVATLGSDGKVPAIQLPSYVDDVLEFDTFSKFPKPGESGKLYVANDTNKTYRWSGTQYILISETLALGETSSSAYPGDKGKANTDAIAGIKSGSVTVGNAAKVNGLTVQTAVPANAKFTDTVYTHPSSHPATMITTDASHRFVTDTEKSAWNTKANGNHTHDSINVGSSNEANIANGYADTSGTLYINYKGASKPINKYIFRNGISSNSQLASIEANTFYGNLSGNASSASSVAWANVSGKPSTYAPSAHNHDATNITQDGSHRFVTDTEKNTWNNKANASHTHSYLPLSGGTLTGKLNLDGRASFKYNPGQFITGKDPVNASFGNPTQVNSGTYNPIMAGKTLSGHTWNIGAINDDFGFYGFKKDRTGNGTDWSFIVQTSTGNIKCDKRIIAHELYNDAGQSVVYANDSRLSNSRPASDVYAWAKATNKPTYTKAEVGLGNVDNTADANKNVKYAASAGSVAWANVSGKPSSMPASDVSAWAKASTKPTYSASEIGTDSSHKFVTDAQINGWNAKASTTVASQTANGLMAATDKKKLDGIAEGANKYVHPSSHPASMITTDSTHKFVTDAQLQALSDIQQMDIANTIRALQEKVNQLEAKLKTAVFIG